jgi:hypothetical protein
VVKWAGGRVSRPELDDSEQERLTVIGDLVSVDDSCLVAIVGAVGKLRAEHGDAVLLALFDQVFAEWRERAEEYRRFDVDPKHQQEEAEAARRRAADQAARERLEIAFVCDCGRRRLGRKWVKAAPPEGFVVVDSICPNCEGKRRS